MIRLRASAVLMVRDGYSRRAITASAVQCFLDGQRILPQVRQGGYLVFLNMEEGSHELLLRGPYYQDERLTLEVGTQQPVEYTVTLKPSANYPFRQKITRLSAVLEGGKAAAGQLLWAAAQNVAEELRLAQDDAAAGSRVLKVYFRGSEEGRFPGNYLITDRTHSEAVSLMGWENGQATLGAPLAYKHKRGATLLPAQSYRADDQGRVQIVFREATPAHLFCPGKKRLYLVALEEGYNEIALTKALEKKE